MATGANGLAALEKTITAMANDVFDSEEYQRFFAVPLTRERAAYYIFERSHFHLNRRQCWAFVQARSPFDVKQLVWHHERDELAGNAERGTDNHWVLGMREGETVGLSREDFDRPCSRGTMICTMAWSHLATTAPWLEAVAASSMLEVANSDAIVKGGGVANRIARKMAEELDIPLRRQASNVEHMEVEVEHASLLMDVARDHVKSEADAQSMIDGATKTLAINRTWLGLLADAMLKM